MDQTVRADIPGEVIAAARRLIRLATDFPSMEMEEQQCSDTAMADEGDVGFTSLKSGLDLTHNAALRINGTFPAADAVIRPGEELVGNRLEFRRRQEARRRPVVLVHPLPHLDRKAEMPRQDFRGFDRFAFSR